MNVDLAGAWGCVLDRADEGGDAKWFEQFPGRTIMVELPGSLSAQRIGDPPGPDSPWTGTIFDRSFFDAPEYAAFRERDSFKIPFWLQPDAVYVGAAWYRREFELGEAGDWLLVLERPHWRTTVWVDGRAVGSQDSLSVKHVYPLGALEAGRHVLTLRVDNRLAVDVGENAHSVTDHTQGNWNGIIGRIQLVPAGSLSAAAIEVFADARTKSVSIRGSALAGAGVEMSVFSPAGEKVSAQSVRSDLRGVFGEELPLGSDPVLWNEFSPAVWRVEICVEGSTRSIPFGLRDVAVRGGRLEINSQALFLRGALDCCIYPRTGHPPMDVATWRRVFSVIKEYGFNHVRFHSWCPPPAAFVAGDETGLYFQVEVPTWPNTSAVLGGAAPGGLGEGRPIDAWVFAETGRILSAYAHHPCFVFLSAGNEPGGPHHREFLARWLAHFRPLAPRQLLTGASGWPELPGNDFHVIPGPRIHQWGDNLGCRLNAQPPATLHDYRAIVDLRDRPVVAHENGQWCAYPPLADTGKYTGHLHARSYEIFASSLGNAGMAPLLPDFVRASGRLQLACYKEEIESALRTPGLGGFQLLGLQDFPGQGTAPVGLLDAFWDSKGYATAGEFKEFCGPTVPLARMVRRCFGQQDVLEADIDMAHYGQSPLRTVVAWRLVCGETEIACGSFPETVYPVGLSPCGRIGVSLAAAPAPSRCALEVCAGPSARNRWNIWVFPQGSPRRPAVRVTRDRNEALELAARGSSVAYFVPPDKVRGGVVLGFTPIFWNTWCTGGQAPHTLGVLCDTSHPALAEFPTEDHSDWQWWGILRAAAPMVLGAMPEVTPIVRVIDDWRTNRPLGLVFEARCGDGRILVCSAELSEADMASRQLRHSLLAYADSPRFRPEIEITPEQLASIA